MIERVEWEERVSKESDDDEEFAGFNVTGTEDGNIVRRVQEVTKECKEGKLQIPSIKIIPWNKAEKKMML